MIPVQIFPGGCGLSGSGRAMLIALALSLAVSPGAPQTAAQAACAASPPGNTESPLAVCAGADASADAAIWAALEGLSAHGLDPAAYRTEGATTRSAWILAATHLRQGVLEPDTLAPRIAAGEALTASFSAVPPGAGAAAYRAALDALAPPSHLYAALQTELARQQYALATSSDPKTLAAAQARHEKLLVSLEHLRWLPHETTARQIYANIPTFEVVAFSSETEVSRHVAIYGELNRQTPEFSDSIEYLDFSPWWNVPASIARKDKLPQFRADPGAIERLDYRILDRSGKAVGAEGIDWDSVSADAFPYRIRQAPGPANALGQVKFIFPNAQSIYVHDTPDQDLFARTQRAISAGCIRVQDAVALSEWVLEDTPGWDRPRIESVIGSRTATRARLAAPMAIHIIYLTAFPAADGSMAYAPDVYGRDGAVRQALNAYALQIAPREQLAETEG